MQLPPFTISGLPSIVFGAGVSERLPELAAEFGRRVLLVTGRRSFVQSSHWLRLQQGLRDRDLSFKHATVDGEPSPQLADAIAARFRSWQPDLVIGVGGGSVLDAAKAVAGLLRVEHSVMDYLEGVGPELTYNGPAVPFIAVPTTAGTGSEATKNAVLSRQGVDGFKKSFRHEKLVARYAVVDPDLLADCPRQLIAANGMDAFTQLLESYVSTRANPFTDALALSGMRAVRDGLLGWYAGEAETATHRANMAYAALLSGITLAQVGLGSVHGLAAPLGAFFPMPHGVVCGTLVAECTRANLRVMAQRDPDNRAIARYAEVGRLLADDAGLEAGAALQALLLTLDRWTAAMALPRLGTFGMRGEDIERVVAHSRGNSMKTNPVLLSDAEVAAILEARL